MIKFLLKFSLLGLMAMAAAGTPLMLHAQEATATTTNATPKPAKQPSKRVIPFRGKLKAVDTSAKTVSVGNQTIQVTSETRITKMGKPATLEDGEVGENVTGACRKDAEGKLNAITLRFGPKMPEATSNTKTNTP